MEGSRKRNFSKSVENSCEDTLSDEKENVDGSTPNKRKGLIVSPNKKEKIQLLTDLIKIVKKLLPNVYVKDQSSALILNKFIEDLLEIENLIERNEDYDGNIDYMIHAQKIESKLKYVISINSGGLLLDNIGQTIVEKNFNIYTSSYEKNFNEIELLGYGGFGKVYIAEHKIDKMQYAIKKISIESHEKKEIQRTLQEVRTLAKLYHPNIVTYKNSWIELKPSEDHEFQLSSQSQSSYLSSQSNKGDSMNEVNNGMQMCELDSVQEHMSGNESSQESLNIESGQTFTLYIQMALSTMNLRTWIDNRVELSEKRVIANIATQILLGIEYIHRLKIVHHDINPNNILISLTSSGDVEEVQIGDFGLACHLNKKNHSRIGGTQLYTAPEQLKDKCDSKSDIFSFGIVLFELLYPMRTACERCMEIGNLKRGCDLPPRIINNYPVLDRIVKKSIHKNPQKRASATKLLYILNKNEKVMHEL